MSKMTKKSHARKAPDVPIRLVESQTPSKPETLKEMQHREEQTRLAKVHREAAEQISAYQAACDARSGKCYDDMDLNELIASALGASDTDVIGALLEESGERISLLSTLCADVEDFNMVKEELTAELIILSRRIAITRRIYARLDYARSCLRTRVG